MALSLKTHFKKRCRSVITSPHKVLNASAGGHYKLARKINSTRRPKASGLCSGKNIRDNKRIKYVYDRKK